MDLSHLPTAAQLSPQAGGAAIGTRVPRWQPGGAPVLHGEVFAAGRDGSGAAFALALALDGMAALPVDRMEQKPLLWVQDAASIRLTGRPYRPGLPPALRHRIIHVQAKTCEDALFALEEGVRCRDLACVIGEVAGNPRALDFTASRRLSLAAERHGVPLFLVRLDAARDLSSARMRWQVRPAASASPRWNPAAPGAPAWHAELFRSRSHAPGEWMVQALPDGLSASGLEHSSGRDGLSSLNAGAGGGGLSRPA